MMSTLHRIVLCLLIAVPVLSGCTYLRQRAAIRAEAETLTVFVGNNGDLSYSGNTVLADADLPGLYKERGDKPIVLTHYPSNGQRPTFSTMLAAKEKFTAAGFHNVRIEGISK